MVPREISLPSHLWTGGFLFVVARHCEERSDEAISSYMWEIASGEKITALAMTEKNLEEECWTN